MKLEPVTNASRALAEGLAVRPDQEGFVASFEKTLADAEADQAALLRLAIVDRQPVGYLLLLPEDVDGYRVVSILRLAIDQRWQGRGFGRQLLETALRWIDTFHPAVDLVRISAIAKNRAALSLYESTGFRRMGIEDGEVALYLATRHLRKGQRQP
ncbi:MAG: GNAT family N-acetyltransferase [Pseudomonadales bacterium]